MSDSATILFCFLKESILDTTPCLLLHRHIAKRGGAQSQVSQSRHSPSGMDLEASKMPNSPTRQMTGLLSSSYLCTAWPYFNLFHHVTSVTSIMEVKNPINSLHEEARQQWAPLHPTLHPRVQGRLPSFPAEWVCWARAQWSVPLPLNQWWGQADLFSYLACNHLGNNEFEQNITYEWKSHRFLCCCSHW